MHFQKHCGQPWIGHLSTGLKTVEGRLKKSEFALMSPGDTVSWFDNDLEVNTIIVSIREYPSLEEYLGTEGVGKVLPGVQKVEDGCAVYRAFFRAEDEAQYPFLAIELKVLD